MIPKLNSVGWAGALKKGMEGFSDMVSTFKSDLSDTVKYNMKTLEESAQKIDNIRNLEDYGYQPTSVPDAGKVYTAPVSKKEIFKEEAPVVEEKKPDEKVEADVQVKTMSPNELFKGIRRGTQPDFGTQVGTVVDGVIIGVPDDAEDTEKVIEETPVVEEIVAEEPKAPIETVEVISEVEVDAAEPAEDIPEVIEVVEQPVAEEVKAPVEEEIPSTLRKFLRSDVHGVERQEAEAPVQEVPVAEEPAPVEEVQSIEVRPVLTKIELEDPIEGHFSDDSNVQVFGDDESDIIIVSKSDDMLETEEEPMQASDEPEEVVAEPEPITDVADIPVIDVPEDIAVQSTESDVPATAGVDPIMDEDVMGPVAIYSENNSYVDGEAPIGSELMETSEAEGSMPIQEAQPEIPVAESEERICIGPVKVKPSQTEIVGLFGTLVKDAGMEQPVTAIVDTVQDIEAPISDDVPAVEPIEILVPEVEPVDVVIDEQPIAEAPSFDIGESAGEAYVAFTGIEPEFGPSNIITPDWIVTDDAVDAYNAFNTIEPEYIRAPAIQREWDMDEATALCFMGYQAIEPEFGPSNIITPDWVVTDDAVDAFNAYQTIRPQYIRAPVIQREWDITEDASAALAGFQSLVSQQESSVYMSSLPKTMQFRHIDAAPLTSETFDAVSGTPAKEDAFGVSSTEVKGHVDFSDVIELNEPRKLDNDRMVRVTRFEFKNGKLQKVQSEPEAPKRKECRLRIREVEEEVAETVTETVTAAAEPAEEIMRLPSAKPVEVPVVEESVPAEDSYEVLPAAAQFDALPAAAAAIPLPAASDVITLPAAGCAITLPAAEGYIALPEASPVAAAEEVPEEVPEIIPEEPVVEQKGGVVFSFGGLTDYYGSVRFIF